MNVVQEAARMAVEVPELSDKELKSQMALLAKVKSSLLPIEREAAQEVHEQGHRLLWDGNTRGHGYKRLSLEPLRWRKNQRFGRDLIPSQVPVFALYSPHGTGKMSISEDGRYVSPDLPSELTACYRKGIDIPARGAITSTFRGVIPVEVKKAIAIADTVFPPRGINTNNGYITQTSPIYLMAEADWQIKIAPKPLKVDPLVVAFDGLDLWLIAQFDLTSFERYVALEFTTNTKMLTS